MAISSADVVLMHSDPADVATAMELSRATMRNIKQNLFWALFYNAICIPVAAGVLSPWGVTLNPMIGAAAMGFSSVFVVSNALRLRTWKPSERAVSEATPAADVAVSVESVAGASASATERREPTMTKTLNVTGMMCQHCVAHVKKALEGVDGVSAVDVNLEAGTATVEAEERFWRGVCGRPAFFYKLWFFSPGSFVRADVVGVLEVVYTVAFFQNF